MSTFKKGDRVEVTGHTTGTFDRRGFEGTVQEVDPEQEVWSVLVLLDDVEPDADQAPATRPELIEGEAVAVAASPEIPF